MGARKHFDKTISGRVSSKSKTLLDESEYSVRNAIDYFVKELYSNNPGKKLNIETMILQQELDHLKSQSENLEFKILNLEDKIAVNKKELLKYDKVAPINEYDEKIVLAVESVEDYYNRNKLIGTESVLDVVDEDVFKVKAKNCNLVVDEFKKICEEKIS